MTFALLLAGSAQRDALIDGDVVANNGRFTDDDTGAVVDEEPSTQARAGMNIDAGEEARELGETRARQGADETSRASE